MKRSKIILYSTSDTIRSAIRTAFKSNIIELIEVTDASKMPRVGVNEQQQPGTFGRLSLPDRVDAVISTSGLNSYSEGLAASLGLNQNRNDVFVYVLPQALNALREKLDRLGELTLVGADQAK